MEFKFLTTILFIRNHVVFQLLFQEVNAENKEKWYKRMYDSLHKAGSDGMFENLLIILKQ